MRILLLLITYMAIINSCTTPKEEAAADNAETSIAKVDPKSELKKSNTLEVFWQEFQEMIISKDTAKLKDLVSFPLIGAGFIVDRFDGNEVSYNELVVNFDRLFNEFVVAEIKNAKAFNLKKSTTSNSYYIKIEDTDDTGDIIEIFIFIFVESEGSFKLKKVNYGG